MAVSFNTSENYGYEVAALFGVPAGTIVSAKGAGVLIVANKLDPLKFVISGGGYTSSVAVKSTAMTLAKAGNMGPSSKQAIAAQFEAAITAAIKAVTTAYVPDVDMASGPDETVVFAVSDKSEGVSKEALKKVMMGGITKSGDFSAQEAIQTPPKTTKSGKVLHPEEEGQLVGTEKVHLAVAAILGQPVYGTSAKSTYYMVARLDGVNMAIRSKFQKLSIRLEGNKLMNYATALQGLGFKVKTGEYASAHFEVGDNTLVRKTVGAVIGALGMENLVAVMDTDKLVGK